MLHVGKSHQAINKARDLMPKFVGREAVAHFNRIMNGISSIDAKARDALRNYIFLGEADPDDTLGDDYVKLVMDLAAGQPIDESLLVRGPGGRSSNSRGGKGIGATTFEEFWEACREVIRPSEASEERRHSLVVYTSAAASFEDLKRQAIAILQRKVDEGKLAKLPPVPSNEWIRLVFHQNNVF